MDNTNTILTTVSQFINISSIIGLGQTSFFLFAAAKGIAWSAHKVLQSILAVDQLQAYAGYSLSTRIIIGITQAATESIILFTSIICIGNGPEMLNRIFSNYISSPRIYFAVCTNCTKGFVNLTYGACLVCIFKLISSSNPTIFYTKILGSK